jgi:putative methanogenesis marker protein 8
MKHGSDEHIIEAIGRCRIVIRDGKVIEVGEPLIRECPLARRFEYPVHAITPDAVKANIEQRIRAFGMCTGERNLISGKEFVTFGASELISNGIQAGMLDAAVLVCEGAGTVITASPGMVQGIGGRMSGLISTSPIDDLIERISELGGKVLDPGTAAIDQPGGVTRAKLLGYPRIAVTVASPEPAEQIRKAHPDTLIIGVHVTGLSSEEADRLCAAADIVSGCASKAVRESAGRHALLQAGAAVPVFALTPAGKEIILAKIRCSREPVFVKSAKLPLSGEHEPVPLV